MVVADNPIADVIFVIEATAHISPYVESLKNNYIIPSIQHFNGTGEDRDFGGHEINYCSTLFGLVTFQSDDCKPDSATYCYAPTSSSHTFLQYLDKIQFIGGAGDSSSHIAEGLCTALSLFEDIEKLREKNYNFKDDGGEPTTATIKSTKHCILICNSTPYLEPAIENSTYYGYTIDQLTNLMLEQLINFSVFSPRKMHFLYKLFETAGGKLTAALTKNYAKDRRHLVLLNGFHLQEKAISPISQPPSTEQDGGGNKSTQSTVSQQPPQPQSVQQQQQQGIKRPLSPNPPSNNGLMAGNTSVPPQMVGRPPPNQPPPPVAGMQMQQPGNEQQQVSYGMPPMQNRVASPSMNQWNQNGNVPSPGGPRPAQVRAPRVGTPNGSMGSNPQQPMMVPQPSPSPQRQPGQPQMNRGPPPQQTIRPQPSPFANPQAPSPSQPAPSPQQFSQRPVISPITTAGNNNQSVPSPMPTQQQQQQQQQQQFIQQQQMQSNQISQPNMTQGQQQQVQQLGNQTMVMTNPQQPGAPGPGLVAAAAAAAGTNPQRIRIWSGTIEYLDKQASNPQQRIPYQLECFITYQLNNNEPEFKAERWPNKLTLCTVPRNLMNRLSPIFRNNSYQVYFHFKNQQMPNESPGYALLEKAMTNNMVGCIQPPSPANFRMIIVFFLADRRLFIGFIPHNQDEFMSSMKELVENHKKEQQHKQKMFIQQQQMNPGNGNPSAGPPVHMQMQGGQIQMQMVQPQGANQQQQQNPNQQQQQQMFQLQISTMGNSNAGSNQMPTMTMTMANQNSGNNVVPSMMTATGTAVQNQQMAQQKNFMMVPTSQQQTSQSGPQQQQFLMTNTGMMTASPINVQQQPNQMIQNTLHQQQQQQQQSTAIRHQLQQQLQQKQQQQHIQLQQQQHQPQPNMVAPGGGVGAGGGNQQLRHLLQHQPLRTAQMNPNRLNLQQQQQQQQQPILIQQQQQQQQLRFQQQQQMNPVQQQQQTWTFEQS